jgi:hypothetical protein
MIRRWSTPTIWSKASSAHSDEMSADVTTACKGTSWLPCTPAVLLDHTRIWYLQLRSRMKPVLAPVLAWGLGADPAMVK